jgi:hypothetical protein
MALFTDGAISCIDELAAQDSQLLGVTNTEGIDVTQKIALAQEELAVELDILAPGQRRAMVVTPALKLWHTFRTLEMVYSDAYNSQLNDRYAGMQQQFADLARRAQDRVMLIGVGIAADPVPRAATPNVTATAGNLTAGTYYATMSWVNRRGEEGASATPAVATIAGSTLVVAPGNPPGNATGWNVYVGTAPDAMARQNAAALATGENWVQPAVPTTTGPGPGKGQEPNYLRALPRILQRG